MGLQAEIDRLKMELEAKGRELNYVKYGSPDFSWRMYKNLMIELQEENYKLQSQINELKDRIEYLKKSNFKMLQSLEDIADAMGRYNPLDATEYMIILAQKTIDEFEYLNLNEGVNDGKE